MDATRWGGEQMSTGLWVVIDVVVGMALGLLAGVPIGLVLGYDWACGTVARPLINVPANEVEKGKETNGTAIQRTI